MTAFALLTPEQIAAAADAGHLIETCFKVFVKHRTTAAPPPEIEHALRLAFFAGVGEAMSFVGYLPTTEDGEATEQGAAQMSSWHAEVTAHFQRQSLIAGAPAGGVQ